MHQWKDKIKGQQVNLGYCTLCNGISIWTKGSSLEVFDELQAHIIKHSWNTSIWAATPLFYQWVKKMAIS